MSTRFTLAVGVCLALMTVMLGADARAQVIYFGAEGGWSNLEDQRNRFNVAGAPSVKARYDSGFAAGARAGYEWGPWRFEEEYAYRSNDLTRLKIGTVPATGVGGNRQAHAFMTNVLYDFSLPTLGWPITPHVGAGLGAVNVIDRAHAAGVGVVSHGQDWELGYQAIGGVRYAVNPNIALDLDYRYLATTDL